MVHVFVTGAAGYIGLATAQALRVSGHVVHGLVRKQSDVKLLEMHEIIPVVGDISDEKVLAVLDQVSVVVDNVMNFSDNPPLESNRKLMKALYQSSQRAVHQGGDKKRYIYTSGCLVYGDYGNTVVDESYPLKGKVPRVAFEKEVRSFNNAGLETVVVRPGWVYGGGAGRFTADWFKGNAKDEIEVVGNPQRRWGWIHIQDMAAAYVPIVEAAGGQVAGEVFDVNDDTRLTFEEARVLMARSNGVKGPVVHVPAGQDPWSQAMENTAQCAAIKIRQRLGWKPRMGVLQDNIKQWQAAMKASGAL